MPLVTFQMMFDQSQFGVSQSGYRLFGMQQHAQAAKEVLSAGDNPSLAVESVNLLFSDTQISAMKFAATQVDANYNYIFNILQNSMAVISQAKQFALQAANNTLSSANLADIATEVSSLYNNLLAFANTQINGGYLFAGFSNQAAAFSEAGVYQGDGNQNWVAVSPGLEVPTSMTGTQIFDVSGGYNLFTELQNLETAITTNNSADIQTSITNLTGCLGQLSNAEGIIAGYQEQLNAAGWLRDTVHLSNSQIRSDLLEGDITALISNFMQAQTAYEAAVSEAANVIRFMGGGLVHSL